MIVPVARNRFLNLRRDRAALVLSFVLPVAFFSIFAGVFAGGSSRAATRKIRVAVVDQDGSENSRRFIAALQAEKGLTVETAPAAGKGESAPSPYAEADAAQAVRSGAMPVALVIPKGFGEHPIVFGPGPRPTLRVLSDSSDPIAPQLLTGIIQKAAMSAMPDAMARGGMDAMAGLGGGLTPEQRAQMEESIQALRPTPGPAGAEGSESGGLIDVEVRDLVGESKKNPTVAFYAAGFGVMFLLFTAAGAGGALIEEVETGTLDRILSTRVSMGTFLGGKLLYLTALAVAQLTVMFLWGALFFDLELRNHLTGFFVMAISTALAASAFGLLLAAVCRSRMQLVALSNLVILVMSALGGSMFPRFLMPEKMQKIGLITLNAWALDGFQKVFWRDEPVFNLWPQVAVLLGAGALFFALARRVARRWEVA
ncbi:MAG: ABC transporter permease [Thermoanaerobaculia bacterium]